MVKILTLCFKFLYMEKQEHKQFFHTKMQRRRPFHSNMWKSLSNVQCLDSILYQYSESLDVLPDP